ncbi:DUF2203 domain-containing protein, partial [Pyxidicoccus fallax]
MRYFSVEEANRLVPLLTRTFERVRPWVDRAERLADALGSRESATEAHLNTLREERDALLDRIRGELLQLQEMGLEIKGADGLVDFRAHRGDDPVFLCWRFGEPSVTHWHELQDGFAG